MTAQPLAIPELAERLAVRALLEAMAEDACVRCGEPFVAHGELDHEPMPWPEPAECTE